MGRLTGKKSRRTLDLGMTVLMILVMSYQATGNLFHELAGVLLLLLFLCHKGRGGERLCGKERGGAAKGRRAGK